MDPIAWFTAHPWLAAVLWLALHGIDWVLTIAGARLHERALGAPRLGTGYELNPVFREAVERKRWVSLRFLGSWILPAPVFWLAAEWLGSDGSWLLSCVLGLVLFTRLQVIGMHLSNLSTLRLRILQPTSFGGQAAYSADMVYRMSAHVHLRSAVLLGTGALITASPWLFGGACGLGLVTLKHQVLAWRRGAQPAPEGLALQPHVPGEPKSSP